MIVRASILAIAAAAIPGSALARGDVEILIGRAGERDPVGGVLVDLRLLNAGVTPQDIVLPDSVEAELVKDGIRRRVWLERIAPTHTDIRVAPKEFASARYRLPATDAADGALLSVPSWDAQPVALAPRPIPAESPSYQSVSGATEPQTPPPADRAAGNAFVDNLSVYEPIYAVFGPGTDSDARIQISFKYQLFGSREREDRPSSLLDGLYFAYTQRMFWDLGARSSPFRNVDYQPELFYLSSPIGLSDKATLSAQVGLRHESNGRDGAASRSFNTLYVAPMAALSLGGDRRLIIAPRLWLYVGGRSDNPDIRRYRGNSGLFMEVGEDHGLRLSTSTRFNFASGKGSVSADISYPLNRILGGGPDFYVFGQSFIGYGENLLDYNVRTTRFRIGVALVR
ncbi:phospholipase A [Sphingopyxis indica]|uniref:phospholipase A n=1 Tax=Sphingopyxis indica TaxID=436663 RepID=UPI0029390E0D|nr:phospholipase A [Sphingopyxis indica]WOF45016.1 phospholipase A [Sphingopyxis indica]